MRVLNEVLTRNVSNSHFLVKYRAYMFDVGLIENIKEYWHTLRIVTPTGRMYEISKDDFFRQSEINSEFKKDQYLIPTKFLTMVKNISSKSVVVNELVHDEIKREAKRKGITISQELREKYII